MELSQTKSFYQNILPNATASDDAALVHTASSADAGFYEKSGECCPSCSSTALYEACAGDCVETARVLLRQPNIDVNIKSHCPGMETTPVELAVGQGAYRVLRLLLERADVNVNTYNKADWTLWCGYGHTPLILLVSECIYGVGMIYCRMEGVQKIFKGANPRTPPFIVLNDSSYAPENPDMKIYLENPAAQVALEEAVRIHVGMLKTMLKRRDLDVNLSTDASSGTSYTALHMACYHLFCSEYARVLLRHPQIDCNIEDSRNLVALHYAVGWDDRVWSEKASDEDTDEEAEGNGDTQSNTGSDPEYGKWDPSNVPVAAVFLRNLLCHSAFVSNIHAAKQSFRFSAERRWKGRQGPRSAWVKRGRRII